MIRRLLPGSLRAQLAIVIALVMALGVGGSFLAVYRVTGSRLRAQIDSQLRTQVSEWRQSAAHADLSTPAALERAATRFIAAQRYHAESVLIVVQATGGTIVSNNPRLLAREEARERRAPETTGLLDAPSGLATASVAEAGGMRVLTMPIRSGDRTVGTLRVANPLTPVQQAQSSLRRAFLTVGALALLVAIAVGVGLAGLIAAPLRRMARVAGAVEAGDLSVRTGALGGSGEVAVLSDAFDHMLDRLERAFKRQRDFVSDASHELRTPLAVLRAQVELLDRETDTRKRHEGNVTLLRRLDELDRLVSDMLTLASAEAGQLIEAEAIDLHDYFEDLRRDLPLFGDRASSSRPSTAHSRPIPTGSHKCSATSSVTRSRTRRTVIGSRSWPTLTTAASRSPSAIRVPASRPTSSSGSSSASTVSTAAAAGTVAAAALASPSPAPSSKLTAEASTPSPPQDSAPLSGSTCRATCPGTAGRRSPAAPGTRLVAHPATPLPDDRGDRHEDGVDHGEDHDSRGEKGARAASNRTHYGSSRRACPRAMAPPSDSPDRSAICAPERLIEFVNDRLHATTEPSISYEEP